MIQGVTLSRFGPIHEFEWTNLGKINLVIGENGSGKTFLLKALYAAIRTIEEAGRGRDPRTTEEVLFDKLYWTFQPEKLGDLVEKRADGPLSFNMTLQGGSFSYAFGKDTTRSISTIKTMSAQRSANSVFLPAKEVLSLHDVILKSREQDKLFGFDDTYLDLARALQINRQKGRNYKEFAESRRCLEEIIGGWVEFDDKANRWLFMKGKSRFSIETTAEGIKKIAILDMLLGNRYLTPESIVFVDEPESALHPAAIIKLLDIVGMLAERGIQFFIATHSYFVIKKLSLMAQEKQLSIPIASHEAAGWKTADLLGGMPDNAIVDQSIRLYEEEVELALG